MREARAPDRALVEIESDRVFGLTVARETGCWLYRDE
jgi:hypothetical protein